MWPNDALQRLERSGETAKGILLHRMKQKAEGRVCRAAHESTAPRRERRGCNPPSLKLRRTGRCVFCAGSPAMAGLGHSVKVCEEDCTANLR